MIGNSPNLFGSMPDATSVLEHERPFSVPATENTMDSSVARAFTGFSTESHTTDFAQALSGTTTETDSLATQSTESFAHALSSENVEATTTTTAAPEYQQVFGLAEQASAQDALDLAALQRELAELTAELKAKVLEAQAQNPNAVQEEAKILLAQEANAGGIYYVNFTHQLIQSVEYYIQSMKQFVTNSASQSASWFETKTQHNKKLNELSLHAQAAG